MYSYDWGQITINLFVDNLIEIWLADDDPDDCNFFQSSLDQIPIFTKLTVVDNGERLMELLNESKILPDLLFLDLNMPRKDGFFCLSEIKKSDRLKTIPVIILTTTSRKNIVEQLYETGANYFICKPNMLAQLKSLVYKAIKLSLTPKLNRISKEQFVISDAQSE